MAATIIPEHLRGLSFENVWAALMELKESQAETNRQIDKLKESQADTDRIIKKTGRIVKENGRQIGGLHNSFGKLAEHLVAPGIAKRFNELGYKFESMATKGLTIYGEKGKVKAEIDILLENGDFIIAVEVKSKVVSDDIDHHIRRLEILRESKRFEDRKIRGAIAGAIYDGELKAATLKEGLYVLEQSGDTMKLELPEGFIPTEW